MLTSEMHLYYHMFWSLVYWDICVMATLLAGMAGSWFCEKSFHAIPCSSKKFSNSLCDCEQLIRTLQCLFPWKQECGHLTLEVLFSKTWYTIVPLQWGSGYKFPKRSFIVVCLYILTLANKAIIPPQRVSGGSGTVGRQEKKLWGGITPKSGDYVNMICSENKRMSGVVMTGE